MQIQAYVPKPHFIVGVLLTLVLIAVALRFVGNNVYGEKIRGFLGIYPST